MIGHGSHLVLILETDRELNIYLSIEAEEYLIRSY